MKEQQFIEAAGVVRTFAELDNLARLAWRALSEDQISESAAEAISNAVEARRLHLKCITGAFTRKAASGLPRPKKRHPRSPDREASIRRRRTLAASGLIPAAIAARFTTGEAAALAVVAVEVMKHGRCVLCLDRIAALAGISRTTAQLAFRLAARLGLISVTERRQRGWRSLPNVIAVTDKGWAGWIAYRGRRVRKDEHHVKTRLDNDPVKVDIPVDGSIACDGSSRRNALYSGSTLRRSPQTCRPQRNVS